MDRKSNYQRPLTDRSKGKREKNEAREREMNIYIYIFVHEAFFTDRSPVDGDRGLMGLSLTLINSSSERDSLYYAVI